MVSLSALLPYVGFLLCPLGMGLMMWLMMREHRGQGQSSEVHRAGVAAPNPGSISAEKATGAAGRSWLHSLTMCLNPRVILGLAAVALVTWALAPGLLWAVLPLLILAVCPLSMLFMMVGMSAHGQRDRGAERG